MKQILTEWRKFLVEQNQSEDDSGIFFDIPFSSRIREKLTSLAKAPDDAEVEINLEEYLNALYPRDRFPGGWQEVVKNANIARAAKNLPLIKHWNAGTILKIKKINKSGVFGFYEPTDPEQYNVININFKALEKAGLNPITTIIHEIGHYINDGPIAARLSKEIQDQLAKRRGESTVESVYRDMSDFGKVVHSMLKAKLREKDDDFYLMYPGADHYLYELSREESQQRFYRPIKFWYAMLNKKYGERLKGEYPEEGHVWDENYMLKLLDFATPQDYELLRNAIRQTTEGTHSYVDRFITDNIQQILRNKNIYPELVSTVKATPFKSSTQAA